MKTGLLFVLFILAGTVAQAQISSQVTDQHDAFSESLRPETKKNTIRLYSQKEKGTVVVTSHRTQEVQLYVFDVEGTILFQSTMKKNEKKKIDNLAKGTYTYTVFANDESVEEGQLVIK